MTQTISDSPRFSKAALFRRIGYEPHPGQLLVHRSRALRRVVACGSRWGKTVCAAHEVVAAMVQPRERSIGWIVGPSYDLADRVFRLVVQIVRTHFPHRIRVLSEREQRIVLTNFGGGVSEVRGKSADRPASLLGEGLEWLVVDEAAQFSREIWDQYLSQRLIDRGGWALLMSTPKGPGWFQRMFNRGQKGADPMYESWASPSTTNPHLDSTTIAAERSRLPADVFRQEFEAEFIGWDQDGCERCHGPSEFVSSIVVLQEGEELARCPECEEPVDANGRTVVRLGPDGPRLIIVVESGVEVVPVPEGAEERKVPKPDSDIASEAKVRSERLFAPRPSNDGPLYGGGWLDN